jgi:hypothetical protein
MIMGIRKDIFDPEQNFESIIPSPATQSLTVDRETASGRTFTHGFEGRIAELMEGAITSRSLARQYLRTARRFVAAARQARRAPNRSHYEAHLREAQKAHDQARKCLSFARLCRQRAECLAVIGNYPLKPKR